MDLGFLGFLALVGIMSVWGLHILKKGLTRGLVVWNGAWLSLLPRFLICSILPSNHKPIILQLWGTKASLPRQFKFEKFWLRDHSFYAVVESAWNTPVSGAPGYRVYQKLKATKKALQSWNKTFFGHIQTTIQHLTSAISSYQDLPPTTDNLHAVKSLNVALGEQLCREEIF